ncbi:hypothetical protein HU200_015999 [Digitaria exilis]|uniref:Uncharacterized protein n=1 Tax=Digitaria exilis TaxID=1010633 RepID=A0A835KIZ3_9POAL|nr:hypothetical protein HU200_015999 [Digitaria exilis]
MRLIFRRRGARVVDVAGNPRQEPELVGPARPTPRETKRLSDIDDQQGLRLHVPLVLFYRRRVAGGHGDDPAAVVRRALGEALVPYHPLAGRLREVEGRKLVVDCTGEGVLFVEADADVRLADLEAAGLRPPFPYMDQLLSDVEGSGGSDAYMQVTRLLCGGFVVALRLNHTMCDGVGIVQFLSAVGELARGLPAPTVSPPWSRELLDARSPPEPTFPHPEYDPVPPPPPPSGDMTTRTFTFTPTDVVALKKRRLPPHLRDTATTFDVLVASLWIARTAALDIPHDEETRLAFPADVRGVRELGLPVGYYGNALVLPAAVAAAGALRGGGGGALGDAVELVREAKKAATASGEYARSTADLLALRGRPLPAMRNMFGVSDNRRVGFDRVDFGWGKPVYAGSVAPILGMTFLVAVRNDDGEDAIAVPIMLPPPAMDRFASELKILLGVDPYV